MKVQTVYVPVDVSERLPQEKWYGIVNKFGVVRQYYFDGNIWGNIEDGFKASDSVTHWLEPQQAVLLTPEQAEKVTEILEELHDYMERRADTDDVPTEKGYAPNKEMNLQLEIAEALQLFDPEENPQELVCNNNSQPIK